MKSTSSHHLNRTLLHHFRLALGPGLLLAGAAIGVSHLVQATRAGATYGLSLWWVLLLAVISKYPTLEFGPRFAAATGEHMISGYCRMHRGAFFAYLAITIGTMFIIQAAVTVVTAGLAEQLFGFGWGDALWTAVILVFCIALLLVGRYPGLDIAMKIIISVLAICTLVAVLLAFGAGTMQRVSEAVPPSYWNRAGIGFIIAFMGWMPIPLDASVWHSIWTKERSAQTHYKPTIEDARFDFDVGYGSAAIIGVLFFLLGILVMFGSGETFAGGSVAFSAQIVDLYGRSLGQWSTPLVSVAAFIAMLSTTLAVTDIYPRVLSEFAAEWSTPEKAELNRTWMYRGGILVIPSVAVLIVFHYSGFTQLIDFAAGLSFVTAPLMAWFNIHLITSPQVPVEARPGRGYLMFSWACLIFLAVFALAWFYYRFF